MFRISFVNYIKQKYLRFLKVCYFKSIFLNPFHFQIITHHHEEYYKTLCRDEAFSGILTNLPMQNLAGIKWNNLKQNLITTYYNLGKIFPKWLFLVQNEKVNMVIKFCKFRLVYVPNFSLNKRQNLLKRCVSRCK